MQHTFTLSNYNFLSTADNANIKFIVKLSIKSTSKAFYYIIYLQEFALVCKLDGYISFLSYKLRLVFKRDANTAHKVD